MTKEDYMKLSKERLAELLVERDRELTIIQPSHYPQCYEPNGICTNPHRDCVNCPRTNMATGYWTTTTNLNKDDKKIYYDKKRKNRRSIKSI